MEERNDKRDTDKVISAFKLPDEFPYGGILKDNGRDVEIMGNVLEGKMVLEDARTEDPLAPCHLPMEKFIPDGGSVPILGAERPADARKK